MALCKVGFGLFKHGFVNQLFKDGFLQTCFSSINFLLWQVTALQMLAPVISEAGGF